MEILIIAVVVIQIEASKENQSQIKLKILSQIEIIVRQETSQLIKISERFSAVKKYIKMKMGLLLLHQV